MRTIKTWSTPVRGVESQFIPCVLCGSRQFRPRLSCEGFSYVACRGCGLVQINPQPLDQTVMSRYREDYGESYLSYELANEVSFLRLQELALEDAGFYEWEKSLNLSKKPFPKVLDVGCATGSLLTLLRGRGWQVRGVEISTPQAEYARAKRGLDVRVLPLEKNNFPENEFTLVLASHLIEHLNDPAAFVGEVYRILSPGGLFLVTTPNIAGFQARFFKGRWRSAIFDHLYLFSVKTLSQLLLQTGFGVERVITWGGLAAGTAPPPVKRWADRAAKKYGWGDVMLIRAVKRV
ncbi:class I SAM-dependent methyltransferase [Treponema sp. TIM-1]|uniref:class I SAM-dependent methyltransferase n=1 Tax=Treponema sp. TIM-1 TaxID=2898417 RepID=UPI003980C348